MSLLVKDSQEPIVRARSLRHRLFRRTQDDNDASARTLVSPLTLERPGGRTLYWLVFVLLVLFTLVSLGPVYWMFVGGLKTSSEIFQTPPTFWPTHAQWSNYTEAWKVMGLLLYSTNTLWLALGAVILQILVSATAAYSLSKLQPAGKGIIQFCFFCTLMVPPVAYLVPQFVNVSNLPFINVSLINSWAGVLLPEAANAFNILILKSFFDGIPAELSEAARLDGANSWQLFLRIIVPLSRPALAVVAIFTVVATWKDFLWPLLILSDSNIQSLMVALYHESQPNAGLPFNYFIAGLVISSVPPILLFLVFQRQIIRGINLTGLKG